MVDFTKEELDIIEGTQTDVDKLCLLPKKHQQQILYILNDFNVALDICRACEEEGLETSQIRSVLWHLRQAKKSANKYEIATKKKDIKNEYVYLKELAEEQIEQMQDLHKEAIAYESQPQTIKEKSFNWWAVFWFVLACFLIGAFLGFQRLTDDALIAKQHYDSIAEEYQKHLDTFEDDSQEMLSLMDKYMLNSISTDERIKILNEMITLYNLRQSHLQAHYNYIIYHEEDLKAIGFNPYSDKKAIADMQVYMRSVIEKTKNDVENRIVYEAQLRTAQQRAMTNNQYDEYLQILQLLAVLI